MGKLCQNHNFNVRPTQMGGTFPKFYNFHFVNFLYTFMYQSQNFQIPTPTKSIIYLEKNLSVVEYKFKSFLVLYVRKRNSRQATIFLVLCIETFLPCWHVMLSWTIRINYNVTLLGWKFEDDLWCTHFSVKWKKLFCLGSS